MTFGDCKAAGSLSYKQEILTIFSAQVRIRKRYKGRNPLVSYRKSRLQNDDIAFFGGAFQMMHSSMSIKLFVQSSVLFSQS